MAGDGLFRKAVRDARNEFQQHIDGVNKQIRERRSYPSRFDLMYTPPQGFTDLMCTEGIVVVEEARDTQKIDVSSLKTFTPTDDDRYSYGRIYPGLIRDPDLLVKPSQPPPYPQGKRQKISREATGNERNSEKR